MKISILQPNYLPWLGYFDLICKVDTFVIYDDVQYDKNSWRNRNKLKTSSGWCWVTVPVLIKGHFGIFNNEISIDNKINWRRKHLNTIKTYYRKSPFFDKYFDFFIDIYKKESHRLIEININIIKGILKILKIKTKVIFSSGLNVKGEKTERIIKICKELRATHYLSTNASSAYLIENLFEKENIVLEYQNYHHPTYSQHFGNFISHLSVVDLLFNHGNDSLRILAGENYRGE